MKKIKSVLLSVCLLAGGLSAQDYAKGERLYSWAKQELEIKESERKDAELAGTFARGASLVLKDAPSYTLSEETPCKGRFPMSVIRVEMENGLLKTAYLSRLPLYTHNDYWKENKPLATYLKNTGRWGKMLTTYQEKFEYGYEKRYLFERGATLIETMHSGGIVSFVQLILPDISLREGYLFARNWLVRYIVSEDYNEALKSINFEISGELSCSEGGYAQVQKMGEEGVVVISLRIACD